MANPSFIDPENRASIDDARQQFPNAGVEIDADDPLAALLRTLVSQLHRVDAEIDVLFDERFIDSATGRELELLGANVGVSRRTGEADAAFRARVRAGYQVATSDGSFDTVAQIILTLLDVNSANVSLSGPPSTKGGFGDVTLPSAAIDDSALDVAEIAATLTAAAPLGHSVRVVTDESFAFAQEDGSDPATGEGWGQGKWVA